MIEVFNLWTEKVLGDGFAAAFPARAARVLLYFCFFCLSGYFLRVWEKLYFASAGRNVYSLLPDAAAAGTRMFYKRKIFPHIDGQGVYLFASAAGFLTLCVTGYILLIGAHNFESEMLVISFLMYCAGMLRSVNAFYESRYQKDSALKIGEHVLPGTVFFMLGWIPLSVIFGSLNSGVIISRQYNFWTGAGLLKNSLAAVSVSVCLFSFLAAYFMLYDSPALKTETQRKNNPYLDSLIAEMAADKTSPGVLSWLNQYFYFSVMLFIMAKLYFGGVVFLPYGGLLMAVIAVFAAGVLIYLRRRISAYDGEFAVGLIAAVSAANILYSLFLRYAVL